MVTKVLLLDDHDAVRDGMRLLLETQPDLRVVGDGAIASPVFLEVERSEADVALVAQDLMVLSSTAVVRELVRRAPRLGVLLFAVQDGEDAVREALAAGARGYVLQQQPSAQLFEALRVVAQGQVYLAPRVAHLVLADHLRLQRGESRAPGPCDHLSRRERDVFDLLVRGRSNAEISQLLGISTKTVETHRAHVLRKLEVHSLVELVRFAARHQMRLD
jgi:DNA-binding NarL/FixJ family response regulator